MQISFGFLDNPIQSIEETMGTEETPPDVSLSSSKYVNKDAIFIWL